MEGIVLECHGCGSTNVEFDAKRRMLRCLTCGKEEAYSRATINSNSKVAYCLQNAISFFKNGKYENAQHYAMDVLNVSRDNVPAMYMLAYYEEFVTGNSSAMKKFFAQTQEIAMEYDEVRELIDLFLASAYRLLDFEESVIRLLAGNMQDAADLPEFQDFIEKLCPYLISKRTSMNFLTKEMVEIYSEIAAHCNIPKTCFALLKSMESNPDSPYKTGSFFLTSKTRYYFDKYISPIGSIINAMSNSEYKAKFVSVYEKAKEKYKAEAGM